MELAVKVNNLTKKFANQIALDRVNLEIPKNSLYGLLGPNGAGKTTLFSIAAGFLKPTEGTIEVLGVDVARISELRGQLAMLPQDAAFQGSIPVIDQLIMFSRLNGLDQNAAHNAAKDALEIVGLPEVARKSARTLSHGMMKRVALCQAFLGDAKVIFLDEPTAGLDPDNARRIRELVKEFTQDKTVIFSSHNLQEVQDICDYVCVIDKGRVVEEGTMESLTESTFLVRIELVSALSQEAHAALQALPIVESIELTSDTEFNLRLNVSGTGKDEAMKQIYGTLTSFEIYPRSVFEGASLEARFLEVTGGTFDGASST
ncbi:ABC transporter ATP-binding protein [Verrucomicrobia bacterium]|nr:ABC transporter ATP-binding protein [Verrucomicrobiota bacterium]|tara:strand:+ start:693 stop:1643 length:951 start_codon:yes stop_codon:yes gene_type:complete